MTRSVFGDAIDTAKVRINNRKWAFFQPRHVVMAPRGQLLRALRFTITDGRITGIEVIGHPARLEKLQLSVVE